MARRQVVKADSHVLWRQHPISGVIFIKTEYFHFDFKTCTVQTDAQIPHPRNQLSFMLHELVFLGCHLQFASYPYTFASYSYSCKRTC